MILYEYHDSVDIATGYRLDGRGLISGKGKKYFLLQNVQTGSGDHPVSYPMRTEESFSGVKAVGP
jgi:hypothetical protein